MRNGGAVHWATEMGVALGPGQDRELYLAADAIAEAQALIAEHGKLPGIDTLRSSGHGRLATFVRRYGGSQKFRDTFGL